MHWEREGKKQSALQQLQAERRTTILSPFRVVGTNLAREGTYRFVFDDCYLDNLLARLIGNYGPAPNVGVVRKFVSVCVNT